MELPCDVAVSRRAAAQDAAARLSQLLAPIALPYHGTADERSGQDRPNSRAGHRAWHSPGWHPDASAADLTSQPHAHSQGADEAGAASEPDSPPARPELADWARSGLSFAYRRPGPGARGSSGGGYGEEADGEAEEGGGSEEPGAVGGGSGSPWGPSFSFGAGGRPGEPSYAAFPEQTAFAFAAQPGPPEGQRAPWHVSEGSEGERAPLTLRPGGGYERLRGSYGGPEGLGWLSGEHGAADLGYAGGGGGGYGERPSGEDGGSELSAPWGGAAGLAGVYGWGGRGGPAAGEEDAGF